MPICFRSSKLPHRPPAISCPFLWRDVTGSVWVRVEPGLDVLINGGRRVFRENLGPDTPDAEAWTRRLASTEEITLTNALSHD